MGPDGRFVVVWHSLPPATAADVFGQRYGAAGNPIGAEFRVNSYTTFGQQNPRTAVAGDGTFVVAWTSDGQDGSYSGVFGQRYDASGNAQGAEFGVNSYTTGVQTGASISADRRGNFVVAWSDFTQQDIVGRRFASSGAARGGDFQVNTFTTGYPFDGVSASDEVGNFVVTWTRRDGYPFSQSDIYAQRFGGLRPVALGVDGTGNAVWEPGEFVEVKPTWRNINGAAQTFGGALSNIAGPPGAVYGIIDSSASYGTVANNGNGSCTDCYSVIVNNPPTRPATHWDASIVETITPDAHGQEKQWLLHVGGSFTDLPASNPFYRFVETLFHRGVTGGCAANSYCPANPTTRDQMSVFVLVAKEGAGYAPPPCAPPNIFNDVPETNPFCRFIEELSIRGVVGGCGGGNYCPAGPVTREQMAIFVLRTLDPALNPPACTTPVFQRRPGLVALLPLDRGTGAARRGDGLWRRVLLPGGVGDPRADGRVPQRDVRADLVRALIPGTFTFTGTRTDRGTFTLTFTWTGPCPDWVRSVPCVWVRSVSGTFTFTWTERRGRSARRKSRAKGRAECDMREIRFRVLTRA